MDKYDIARTAKAPFQDPNWLNKTLMGLLWGILGVTAPAIYGAQLAYIRNVYAGNELLPEWEDFGTKWVEGFLLGLAYLIYTLPLWIVGGIFVLPGVLAGVAGGNEESIGALLGGGACIFTLVAIVYSVACSYLLSAAMTHYAMRRTFGSLFEFKEILGRVRGNTNYFGAWIWLVIVSMVVSTVTGAIGGVTGGLAAILMPAVSYLVAMVGGHLLGQWARFAYPAPGSGVGYAQPVAPVE